MSLPDPFRIAGPAMISFSGGRTSAYMLWRILNAHGGKLPEDVVVCFANTGREMPATLDFVRDCGAAWNVVIRWLEYRHEPRHPHAVEVSHNSASRNGEPFTALIEAKKRTPNPLMRFCTDEMKVATIRRWIKAELGWSFWTNVVGLRKDEPKRVAKKLRPTKEPWVSVMPLNAAGIRKPDVLYFWENQPFDLRLAGPWEGNCDGCFLKSRASIMRMCRDHPTRMQWFADQETERNGTFRKPGDRETYTGLLDLVRRTPMLPMDETMHELGEACDDGCG